MERILPNIREALAGNEALPPAVVALGNFDGVHRGHRAVIQSALTQARRAGLPARAVTFEPHPRCILRGDKMPFRLTPAAVKVRMLKELGVDEVLTIGFTEEMANLSAQDFAEKVLVGYCGAKHVVAGFNFVFGHEQGGDMGSLRTWLGSSNIDLTEVAPLRDAQGEVLSSTRARKAVHEGNMAQAESILGRPYCIEGEVIRGVQRGTTLGFPTANVLLGDYMRPRFGAYVVSARPKGQKAVFPGVANIGIRPTVGTKQELLEIHLFDFHADIYGQTWEVDVLHFLRAEEMFPDLKDLQTQISNDVEQAKAYFARPICLG